MQTCKIVIKPNVKSTISSSQNPWRSHNYSIMLIQPMRYEHFPNPTSHNSKLLIHNRFRTLHKSKEILTGIQTAPKTTPGCPQAHQMVSRLSPRSLPDVPKRVQAAPQTSPGRPQALPKSSLKVPNHFKSYAYSRHLLPTCVRGPRLEGQCQRSQVRGPGFMVVSEGPRRVCDKIHQAR